MQWFNTIAAPSKPQKNFTVLQLNGPQQSTFCSSHTSNLLLSDPKSQWSTMWAWEVKGNKSLLVGLNLFYMEGSLRGSADQKAENHCVMCGSTGAWKHCRDAAGDMPQQLVLHFTRCSPTTSMQEKAESHHCQKWLTAWLETELGTQELTKHNSGPFVFL